MLKTLLILTDIFPIPNKKDFDNGIVSEEFNQFIDILRSFFLTSNAIRKQRTLYFVIQQENVLIEISGQHLQYLATDFRTAGSIVVNFLQIIYPVSNKKIIIKKRQIFQQRGSVLSSPGIIINKLQKNGLEALINHASPNLYLLHSKNQKDHQENKQDINVILSKESINLLIPISESDFSYPNIPSLCFSMNFENIDIDFSEQLLWLNFLEDRCI